MASGIVSIIVWILGFILPYITSSDAAKKSLRDFIDAWEAQKHPGYTTAQGEAQDADLQAKADQLNKPTETK